MPALRPLKSRKTSSTVRGLYCGPPSISETVVLKTLKEQEKKKKAKSRELEGRREANTGMFGLLSQLFILFL